MHNVLGGGNKNLFFGWQFPAFVLHYKTCGKSEAKGSTATIWRDSRNQAITVQRRFEN